MTTAHDPQARKRPVNLALYEDLVRQAREFTGSLSATVESLPENDVADARRQRVAAPANEGARIAHALDALPIRSWG